MKATLPDGSMPRRRAGGTATGWPDVIVAAIMAGLFLSSAFQIVTQALAERRQAA